MIKKLLPLLLGLTGLAAGLGAGVVLRPAPDAAMAENDAADAQHPADAAHPADTAHPADSAHPAEDAHQLVPEYATLNNPFVVPLVQDGEVRSMVILSLSLEVTAGSSEAVYSREPKLRDVFLQVLFDHANAGGFSGSFTDPANLSGVRDALREIAVKTMGDIVTDVLISNIVRQDS